MPVFSNAWKKRALFFQTLEETFPMFGKSDLAHLRRCAEHSMAGTSRGLFFQPWEETGKSFQGLGNGFLFFRSRGVIV